MSMIRKFE